MQAKLTALPANHGQVVTIRSPVENLLEGKCLVHKRLLWVLPTVAITVASISVTIAAKLLHANAELLHASFLFWMSFLLAVFPTLVFRSRTACSFLLLRLLWEKCEDTI